MHVEQLQHTLHQARTVRKHKHKIQHERKSRMQLGSRGLARPNLEVLHLKNCDGGSWVTYLW